MADVADELKVCSRCRQMRPRSDFHADRRRRDGLYPYCKPCRMDYDGRQPQPPRRFATKAEYDRHYRASLPPQEKSDRHRRKYLWTQYRITVEDYERMLLEQDGRCAICKQPETRPSTSKYDRRPGLLTVDHDHACCSGSTSCGRCVRGLLCAGCNAAIGGLKDDPSLMVAAAAYIQARRG